MYVRETDRDRDKDRDGDRDRDSDRDMDRVTLDLTKNPRRNEGCSIRSISNMAWTGL